MIEQMIAKIALFAGAIFAIFKAGKYKSDAVNAEKRAEEYEQLAVKEIKLTQAAAIKAAELQKKVDDVKNDTNKLSASSASEQLRKLWSKTK